MQKSKLQFKTQKFAGLIFGFLVLVFPASVLAADAPRDIPLTLSIWILGQGQVANLAAYIGLVYQYLVGIAGLLAMGMITYGGVKWIFSGGDSGKISAAKETINNAVIGLILALGSFLLLNTINPNLVNLRMPEIKKIENIPITKMGFCPNTGSFEGRFNCGRIFNLKGGTQGEAAPEDLRSSMNQLSPQQEMCVGSHCPSGFGGCWFSTQITPGPSKASYECVDTTKCATKCADIRDQSACNSEACQSLTQKRCWWQSGKCEERIATGDHCELSRKLPAFRNNDAGDFTCADLDAVCEEAGINRCTKVGVKETGASCTHNEVCKSGRCQGSVLRTAGVVAGGYAAGAVGTGVILGYTGAGAALGSVVPGLGTAVGVAGGLVVGGITYGVYQVMSNGTCQ